MTQNSFSINISIHAPARGATSPSDSFRPRFLFQSTLPRGERLLFGMYRPNYRDFNPRSREGSDNSTSNQMQTIIKFQSTLPRGERHVCAHVAVKFHDFNPRSREGSDSMPYSSPSSGTNFNPRSREGSDLCASFYIFHIPGFQSTLPRGERPLHHSGYPSIT